MYRTRTRPRFDILEDRWLLSTVTNLADDGPGSLRAALAATPDGGTVDFAPGLGATLTLTGGPLVVAKNLTVAGPGAANLTLNGDHRFPVLSVAAGSSVTASGLTLTGGRGTGDGGAVINHGNLTLTDCAVSASTAPGNGGGLFNDHGALTLINCTVSGNGAGGHGGGVYNNDGALVVTNSAVAGNSTAGGSGGGLYVNTGTAVFTNDTVANNAAAVAGGGVYLNGGTLAVLSNTVAANRAAGAGGGFRVNAGTLTMRDTLIATNQAATGPDLAGTVATAGYDLLGVGDGTTGVVNGANGNQVGTSAAPLNPLLGQLKNNGGPTPTVAVFPGSPAIDAGDPTGVPATDQRGYRRVVGAGIDIGACEYQPPATAVALAALTPSSAGQSVTFRAAVTATAPGSNTPDGTVTFLDGGRALATVPLSGGQATFATAALPGGSHRITARYNGLTLGDYTLSPSAAAPANQFVRGGIFALGAAPGRVQVRATADGSLLADFAPYGAGYTGPVSVAVGDVNGDGFQDLVTSPTVGNAQVKVYDGRAIINRTFDPAHPDASLLTSFFPYGLQFNVGANVAVGDVSGNGFADVVTGASAGNPHVKVYSGLAIANGSFHSDNPDASLLASFFPYAMQFNVGANVAVGDVSGDGYADVVTGATAGNPHVKVYSGAPIAHNTFARDPESNVLAQWFAYGLQFNVGANVAVADVSGDGFADVITGATAGNPHVKVFDGKAIASGQFDATANVLDQFFAYDLQFNVGAAVAAADFDGAGRADILTGASRGSPHFRAVHGDAAGTAPPALFEAIPLGLQGGLSVGA